MEAAEVAGVRASESPTWIAGVVATAAAWVAAEETASATETFREALALEAAARLVVAASAAALPVQVVHEVRQAWEAAALEVVVVVASVVADEAVVVVGAAAEVVDGSAKVMKAPKEISEAKNESTT